MWINVKAKDGPHFSLPIPLSFVGSWPAMCLLTRINGSEYASYAPFMKEFVREMRQYVRKHGHFTLVEVISSEGDYVEITL